METFDFIVVGSCSAGSVLADRVSRTGDATVLVFDAGGRSRPQRTANFQSYSSDGVTMRWQLLFGFVLALASGLPATAQVQGTPPVQTGNSLEVQEGAVSAGPHRIFYREMGNGRPVVLLHGLGGDTSRWDQTLAPVAAAGYRAIAIDMLGFGRSDKPAGPYRVATLAESLRAFLDARDLRQAVIVGNSLGGWAAAELTLADPSRVSGLVLVDAGYGYAAGTNPATLPARAMPSSPQELRAVLELIFADRTRFVSDEALERVWAASRTADNRHVVESLVASIMRREDLLDGRLRAIQRPTLVVSGKNDRLTPLALSERMAREIPGAQLVAIDRCGHMPEVECPEPFNAALIAFLRELDAKGRAP